MGIYFSGSWNYNPFVQDITGFKFGVMPSPVGSASGSAILGGAGLAVPTNAKNKDLAIEFLKWFYTDKNFADYLDVYKRQAHEAACQDRGVMLRRRGGGEHMQRVGEQLAGRLKGAEHQPDNGENHDDAD